MVETATEPASAHDLELVALAATGGRAAFGELARRHASAVRALLRRMGAEPALADDLAQDAFVIAFQQIGEFRGEGAFQAWVKRIAGRLYVRRLRREERFAKAMLEEDVPVGAEGRGIEARIDLDAALQGLPDVERVVIGLTFGAGLSHQEAAAALNAPLGTVKSHVKRGLARLRRRLVGGGAIEDEEAAHA
ncbi:MAG: RNA polymerase sigma factor [Caulobacteraceae bacterium]